MNSKWQRQVELAKESVRATAKRTATTRMTTQNQRKGGQIGRGGEQTHFLKIH